MNEWNFPAVEGIHVLLKELKFGRHFKGKFLLTKAGKELIAHPARVMSQLVPIFFFRMDHSENLREEDQILGHWDIFLNIINVEADHGATKTKIRETLYGQPVRQDRHRSLRHSPASALLGWVAGRRKLKSTFFRLNVPKNRALETNAATGH
jgi:hypothetical protein